MKRALICVGLAASLQGAWAINKCTLADGRVVYQEPACPTAAKDAAAVKTWGAGRAVGSDSTQWEFVRRKDPMTGKLTCGAFSGPRVVFAQPGELAHQRPVTVRLFVLFKGKEEQFALMLDDDRDRFDRDVTGMGVKTPVGVFTPITIASGGTAIVANSAAILEEMARGGSLQARIKVWPWDRLHDLAPFSMAGFTQAMKQGRLCAESLP